MFQLLRFWTVGWHREAQSRAIELQDIKERKDRASDRFCDQP